MCELLGVSSLHPVTLEMSFQSLVRHSGEINPDGWGAVFYEHNDAFVFREPRIANDSQLAKLLAHCGIASHLVLSHIRKATTGPVELRNTHPFTREIHGRLHSFAFNGNVPDVFDFELTMERFCPIGETDGEFVFCWLMEQLVSRMDNGNWELTAEILQSLGNQLADLGPANFLYSDSLRLYAFASRRSHSDGMHAPGLYHTSRRCDAAAEIAPCIGLTIRSTPETTQQLTLLASVPLSAEDWTPFQENQLVVLEKGQIIST